MNRGKSIIITSTKISYFDELDIFPPIKHWTNKNLKKKKKITFSKFPLSISILAA